MERQRWWFLLYIRLLMCSWSIEYWGKRTSMCEEINLLLHMETKFQNRLGVQTKCEVKQVYISNSFKLELNIKISKSGGFIHHYKRVHHLMQDVLQHVADPSQVVSVRRIRIRLPKGKDALYMKCSFSSQKDGQSDGRNRPGWPERSCLAGMCKSGETKGLHDVLVQSWGRLATLSCLTYGWGSALRNSGTKGK